ncbi:MAG: hypothetical protein QM736_15200 [Vicinamibacterales bacterium]
MMVAVLKLWKPKNIMRLEGDRPVDDDDGAAYGGSELVTGVDAVHPAGRVRAGVGRAEHQEGDSTTGRNGLMPSIVPGERSGR